MGITKVTNKPDVIKDNYEIFYLLLKRFDQLELTQSDIVRDAKENECSITDSVLSKYKNSFDMKTKSARKDILSGMSQDNILWLCKRYGVEVKVTPTLVDLRKTPYAIDNKIYRR